MDNKRKCIIEGCSNVGEWDRIENFKTYRRRLCSSHRRKIKKKDHGKYTYAREIFKRDRCGKCEYCGWEGPCDCHRPVPSKEGGRYVKHNMRSACPSCHRLISLGIIIDKYKII